MRDYVIYKSMKANSHNKSLWNTFLLFQSKKVINHFFSFLSHFTIFHFSKIKKEVSLSIKTSAKYIYTWKGSNMKLQFIFDVSSIVGTFYFLLEFRKVRLTFIWYIIRKLKTDSSRKHFPKFTLFEYLSLKFKYFHKFMTVSLT